MKLAAKLEAILRSLLFRKFETVEILLALSMLVHGVWLIAPGWAHIVEPSTPFYVQLIAATVMILAGGVHAPLVLNDLKSRASLWLRKILSMASFIGHGFLFILALLAVGTHSIFILPYVILTLLGALAYLSMAVTDHD